MNQIPDEILDFFKTSGAWLYGGRFPASMEKEEMELYSPSFGMLENMSCINVNRKAGAGVHRETVTPENPVQKTFRSVENFPVNPGNNQHREEENPSVSEEEKIRFLKQIYGEIRECTKCPLCSYRKNAVPGMGSTTPLVMAIGEGPGADENEQGLPFVGKAGQLLDKMLTAINLSRKKNVYIANVVKCRPPNNRTPTVNETSACLPFLKRQIEILKPKLILALGRTAVQALLNTTEGINFYRGKVVKYNNSILLMATYHPSALLRDEHLKRPAWEDLKKFRQLILSVDPDYENTFTESPTKDTSSGV